MSRRLLGVLALVAAVTSTGQAQTQDRWRIELRGGAAFPTEDLGNASLNTGFGFEGTAAYRIQPHLWLYAGWDWHRFTAEASFAGAENDFEETGYAFGLLFEHPIGRSEAVSLQVRGGGTFNHIEIENTAGDPLADSDHGLGWEAGLGAAFRLREGWQVAPGVRYRSLSRDLTLGSVTTQGDLRYLAVEVGFSRNF